MSVSAQDALLRQSLEQSLRPNEEDSTDSTSAPAMGPGSTFISVALQRELMIVLLVRANRG